jgi:hypothetical protein
MQDVMQVVQLQKKGVHLNTIERFYIHKEAAANNHLNDDHTLSPNKILKPFSKTSKTETFNSLSPTSPLPTRPF